LLKKDQMYVFFLTRTNKGYFKMTPKYGGILLNNEESKISGNFPVKCRMVLVSEYIGGDFPVMQSKASHFRIFRVNRRNLSVYLSLF
jgi:hypothetical protein